MSVPLDSLYQQIILDHYKRPHHRGLIDPFGAEVHHVNPTCGDEVTLRVRLADGVIADLGWDGEGCSISQASTSVMSDLVVGRAVDEAMALQHRFLELMQSRGHAELTDDDEEALDDAIAFEGVSKYPARVKCALLGWMAMKSAVAEAGWQSDEGDNRMSAPTLPSRDEIDEAMRDVVDPELGINVVDLGLVYDARVDAGEGGNIITIDMTLTSAACPLTDVIEDQANEALTGGPKPLAAELKINWVWLPPWGPDKITDDGREQLRALGFNV